MNRYVVVSALSCLMAAAVPTLAGQQPGGQAGDHSAMHSSAAPMQGMPAMHGGMQRMQELMTKIQASKDPAEVKRLLHEHMTLMSEQMKSMHGMAGAETMQERMGMIQGMMEQMMAHMSAEHAMAQPEAPKQK